MTEDEAFTKLSTAEAILAEFNKFFSSRFTSASNEEQRDMCFGYSCGQGIQAVNNALAHFPQIRVAVLQIHQSDRSKEQARGKDR